MNRNMVTFFNCIFEQKSHFKSRLGVRGIVARMCEKPLIFYIELNGGMCWISAQSGTVVRGHVVASPPLQHTHNFYSLFYNGF